MTKICIKCKQELPATLEFFSKNRNTLQPSCKPCKAKASKEWSLANPGKVQARAISWSRSNPEKRNAIARKWSRSNPEKVAASGKSWRLSNIDKVRGYTRKRRTLILGNEHTPYTEQEIIDIYGTNCHICLEPIDFNAPRHPAKPGWQKGFHIDHLIPVSKNGSDTLENVRPAHALCNISKSNKII